jgi:hypothetical protein
VQYAGQPPVLEVLTPFRIGLPLGFHRLGYSGLPAILSHGPGDGPQQFTDPHHPPSRVARQSSKPVSRETRPPQPVLRDVAEETLQNVEPRRPSE